MASDIIDIIKKAEADAKDSMAKSRTCAAEMKKDAEAAGKKLLENVKSEEEKKLGEYIKALEEASKTEIENGLIESKVRCDMMREAVKSKIDSAARAVCERIVGEKWQ